VKIVEFIPHWVDIDKRYRISLQSKHDSPPPKLGENVTIGGKICDYSGKFRVVLGPLNLEAFRSFLPGGTNAEALHSLVQFYAPDFLDFDVELVLRKEDVPELKLGEKQAPLGQICWLGRPSSDVSVVLYYRR
jgi:type VI secretion system protein ImpH